MAKDKKCVFCEEYRNDDSSIFHEDKYFFARYDKFPVSPGHTEIIPIRHIDSLDKLTQKEWNSLFSTIKEVKKKINDRPWERLQKNLQEIKNTKSEKELEAIIEENKKIRKDISKHTKNFSFWLEQENELRLDLDAIKLYINKINIYKEINKEKNF